MRVDRFCFPLVERADMGWLKQGDLPQKPSLTGIMPVAMGVPRRGGRSRTAS